MRAGDTLKLVQGRRGDADPPPDALQLQRELWLDHGGHGYTVHDHVAGELHKAWRLDVSPRLELGRVAVWGRDQFITRAAADGPMGVELRQGAARLEADSRVEGDIDHLPAVGWRHDFKSVTEELEPAAGLAAPARHRRGHRVAELGLELGAAGPLPAARRRAGGLGKLFGWGWGLAAVLALGLCHQESGAPHALWLVVIGFGALVRVLPAGKLHKLSRLAQLGLSVILVVVVAAFVVQQVRQAMYPDLEAEGGGTPEIGFGHLMAAPVNALAGNFEPPPPPMAPAAMEEAADARAGATGSRRVAGPEELREGR